MLDSARRKVPVRALASWLLGLGIAATLAANVAHGLGDGLAGATVAAWPTVAVVGSYQLLMMIIRSAAAPPEQSAQPPSPRGTHDLRHDRTFGQDRYALSEARRRNRDNSPAIRLRAEPSQPTGSAGRLIPGSTTERTAEWAWRVPGRPVLGGRSQVRFRLCRRRRVVLPLHSEAAGRGKDLHAHPQGRLRRRRDRHRRPNALRRGHRGRRWAEGPPSTTAALSSSPERTCWSPICQTRHPQQDR